MSPAQNPHTPHHAITLHYRITSLHYTIALRHCITPLRHNTRSTRSTAYTLGRRYKPISSHNRAARHSRATLQPQNVPQQFCAAPSGNTSPLFRRRNVRIDPVMNMLGDTFGTPWATIQAHIATPIEPHCTFGRHYYVPERVVVDDGAAGCNCSHKKANNTCN